MLKVMIVNRIRQGISLKHYINVTQNSSILNIRVKTLTLKPYWRIDT